MLAQDSSAGESLLMAAGVTAYSAPTVPAQHTGTPDPVTGVVHVDPALLLCAIEVYETDRIDFAEAYLVACAESTAVGKVASFDRSIDRVHTIERIEPPPV
jgi:hypothetical protein